MTTVAYTDGILAADSLISTGNYILPDEPFDKLVVTRRGWAAGWGNQNDMVNGFRKMLRKQHNADRIGTNKTAFLEMDKRGFLREYDDRMHFTHNNSRIIARGSGMAFALGAMAQGATAVQALVIACKYDQNTGGPILWIDFREGIIHRHELG